MTNKPCPHWKHLERHECSRCTANDRRAARRPEAVATTADLYRTDPGLVDTIAALEGH